MTTQIQSQSSFSNVSLQQNRQIAEELARLMSLTEQLESETAPVSPRGTKGKGVSQSGKGGNQNSFNAGKLAPVTAKTVLNGIAKTFLSSTPQGKFDLLKSLGMPVEEINEASGLPKDSTEGVDSPDIGNYFLEIAKAMTASNNGNNASITASLQDIAAKKQQLSTISVQLQTQASSANDALQTAHADANVSTWDTIKGMFTWKAIVIMVAVGVAMAVGAAVLGPILAAAMGPLLATGEATAGAAATTASVATEAASTATEVTSVAGTGSEEAEAANSAANIAKQASTMAQKSLKIYQEAAVEGNDSIATQAKDAVNTANDIAEKAKDITSNIAKNARNAAVNTARASRDAADAAVQTANRAATDAVDTAEEGSTDEAAVAARKTLNEAKDALAKAEKAVADAGDSSGAASGSTASSGTDELASQRELIESLGKDLKTLKQSVSDLKEEAKDAEEVAKDSRKWYRFDKALARAGRSMRINRELSTSPRLLDCMRGLKAGLTVGALGAGTLTIAGLAKGSSSQAEVVSAQLADITAQTNVLTNQSQIVNMGIQIDQTQINNYNDRCQADEQMAQQIIAQMSQVFRLQLN